jgi:hypothetical protein
MMTIRVRFISTLVAGVCAAAFLSSCHDPVAPVSAPPSASRPAPTTPAAAPATAAPVASAVDHPAASLASTPSNLPTPESVWGFAPGQDNRLATYDQSIKYFQKLAAASKNIQLFEAGKTSEGRTEYYAVISTIENLAKLDRYREIAQRIAHPEGLTDDEAHALAREGKAIIHIDGGLHATESAGPQHTPLLAYDILRRVNDPDMHAELENVILMLWPTINPDGQQMVAEYAAANQGRQFPGLYQAYVGHDNNRDAYMLNMIESRVVEHVWRQWEPDIIHVHHQGAPAPMRIWFPPFAEPIATWAPPLMSREVNELGMAMARAEDEAGHPGSGHMGRPYDAWYPGYIDYNPMFKNIVAYWTETAANGGGGGGGRGGAAGQPERPQSLYSSPWTPGSPWNLRSAIEYMETASLGALDFAARHKDSIIYDRYMSGRDQIALGKTTAPYAYVVPQDQTDPVAPVEMLRRLAFQGVRVSQLTGPATIDGATYPVGTWVVPTDQEFAAVAREVLDVQKYPEVRPGGPNTPLDQPYDAAGWTLPMTMNVKVVAAATPLAADVRAKMKLLGPAPDFKVKPTAYNMTTSADAATFDSVPGIGFNTNAGAAAIVPLTAPLTGSGSTLAVDAAQTNVFRALNQAWKAGWSVQLAMGTGGSARYLISGLSAADQQQLVTSLALKADRSSETGVPVKKPRVGLFEPVNESQDAGWTRWLFEQYGFDIVTLHTADFHTPLSSKVDVVVLASDVRVPTASAGGGRGGGGRGAGAAAVGGAAAGANGAGAGAAGATGAGAAAAGSQGRGGVVADVLSTDDLKAFEEFIRAGGVLVCMNSASTFGIQQFELPVTNVLAGVNRNDFFTGGSVMEVQVNQAHPVMAGMPAKAAIFVDASPAFETGANFKGAVLARYQESGSPLRSGYLQGEKYINGKIAALDVALDKGHVILLGFRPQWRDQTFGTFKVLFNAVTNTPVK